MFVFLFKNIIKISSKITNIAFFFNKVVTVFTASIEHEYSGNKNKFVAENTFFKASVELKFLSLRYCTP